MYHRNVVHSPSDLGISWGDVGSFFKKAGGGALDIYGSQAKTAGQLDLLKQQAQQRMLAEQMARAKRGSFMDNYGLPLLLAGVGIGVYFLVIKKKK